MRLRTLWPKHLSDEATPNGKSPPAPKGSGGFFVFGPLHVASDGATDLKPQYQQPSPAVRAFTQLASVALASTFLWSSGCTEPKPPIDFSGPTAEWRDFAGTPGALAYSPITQIDRDNVRHLERAWEYRHGDFADGTGEYGRTSFQARPLVIGDSLFFCTGFNRVIALEAETGRERWAFDPELRSKAGAGPYPLTCRGVAYWEDSTADADACAARIFTATRDSELIALDAVTGRPCDDFGNGGRVDLREGIGPAEPWEYYPTSPPVVVRDLVVTGALVADNVRTDAPPGVIRAFDARTGRLAWAWDPVPPGWKFEPQPGGPSYQPGTPNAWTILSADEERGFVFVPTGNPSPDLFAAVRNGLDYYGSAVVALDATTGKVVWHFQTVHKDVWDYDVPSQPVLFDIDGVGDGAPGLLQATKMGHVFLLNRETGEPLYPIEERAVPTDGVPGEILSPTQPFPTHPAPLHDTRLTADDAFGFTPFDRSYCADLIKSYRYDGVFTPPSLQGSIQFPGSAGGPNWGGVSVDPVAGVMFMNQIHAPMVVQLIPREEFDRLDPGSAVYPEELYPMAGAPYGVRRGPFLSNWGAPCNPPPWGTLTAVDLKSGKVLWDRSFGTTRDMAPWPLWLDLGAPNLGGSVVTAGGVLFIGATTEKIFRAFDTATGEELWSDRLPFTPNASPISYRLTPTGKQYVVIPAGGHGWSEPGDALIAYTLPD